MKYETLEFDKISNPAKGFILLYNTMWSSSDLLIKCSYNKMTKQHENSFIKHILRLAINLGPSELRELLLTINTGLKTRSWVLLCQLENCRLVELIWTEMQIKENRSTPARSEIKREKFQFSTYI